MTAQRLLGFPVLLLVAGCATTGVTPRSTLVPRNGPNAHISASYDGGLTVRSLRASFSVDRRAYVMVGHLGGDGRIEILYPKDPTASSLVQAKKTYAVKTSTALYDGVPQLFSYASRAYRSVSARMDSYDGRGNGFIFIVASQYPLDMNDLATDGIWDEYEVDDYASTSDPRYAIHLFAQHVTRGAPYTLDYADNFRTNAFTSYATAQVDCSMLSGLIDHYLSSTLGLSGFGGFYFPIGTWAWSEGSNWMYSYRPSRYYTRGNRAYGGCDYGFRPFWIAMNTRLGNVPPPPNTPTTIPVDSETTSPGPLAPPMWNRRATPGAGTGSENGSALALTRMRLPDPSRPTRITPFAPSSPRPREANPFGPNRPRFDSPPHSWESGTGSSNGERHDATRAGTINAPARMAPMAPMAPTAPATPARTSTPSTPAPSTPSSSTTEIVRRPEL